MDTTPDVNTPAEKTPAMTRLKELPAPDRDRIMELLAAGTYAEARPAVEKIVGCDCPVPTLCRFFHWQNRANHVDGARDLIQQMDFFFSQGAPGWNWGEMVGSGFDALMAKALALEDLDAFIALGKLDIARRKEGQREEQLKVVRAREDRAERHLQFRLEKFKDERQTRLDAGLEAVGEALVNIPWALEIWRDLIARIRKGQRFSKAKAAEEAQLTPAVPPNPAPSDPAPTNPAPEPAA
jgi:hypothetical protein